jgi:hypothetical protein
MFGNDGGPSSGVNCLSYANISGENACITSNFTGSSKDLVFGPVPGPPGSTMTISHLAAAGLGDTGAVVTVLDNGVATQLACTVTTGTTCNDDVDSVAIPAGDFFEVQVTSGTDWLVTFELG